MGARTDALNSILLRVTDREFVAANYELTKTQN